MSHFLEQLKEVSIAILPMVLVVTVLQYTLIGLPQEVFIQFLIGVLFVGIGLFLFLVGVHIGLLPIGELIGSSLPRIRKTWLIIGVGFFLGLVVTIAEPDVRVLAYQVDQVSDGAIPNLLLVYTVALGVAVFVALAMIKMMLNLSFVKLLAGGYGLVFLLALFTPAQFLPISFDAGGVTTGPMTVPFILALGVGVASVLRAKDSSRTSDGFGFVALASIGPILAVMVLGVIFG
ncbi:DUF1538 domain-containing protein [Alteribacter natronophilus]|uniref:DUF1538 domain-containing protein n=1 Tax=Alteribacter natronophilus TaxID=2583810 RepID=UPI00110F2EC2|nr:DUF1538 domain-containing protein [Alteribacter natronophilus]TMW70323.1 DUF1538 domain-containing protein [Alteribacter natronophilus]